MLGDERPNRSGVGTDDLVGGQLAVLVDDKGGHGGDAELLAQLGKLVDVDLGEEDVLELVFLGHPVCARSRNWLAKTMYSYLSIRPCLYGGGGAGAHDIGVHIM